MRTFARSPFVAALVGGAVVAIVMVAFDVGGRTTTRTVLQPAPMSMMRSPSGVAETGDGKKVALTAHDIYERDAPGVVYVRAHVSQQPASPFGEGDTQNGVSTGSGFAVDDEGYILTNFHVVENATRVEVGVGSTTVPARVTGTDANNDLALLKVDPNAARLAALPLGDSSGAEVGDPVLAIGNPFGLDRTLTTGVVSALQRQITAPNGFAIPHVIQTDASINPGNSGGPLLDAEGRVIGINSQIETGGTSQGNVGIGFAIPIDTARALLDQLKLGNVAHAYLGITGTTIDKAIADVQPGAARGVLVQTVTPDSPCAMAGVHGGTIQSEIDGSAVTLGGDVIEALDGQPTNSMDALTDAVAKHRPGQTVRLTVLHRGQSSTLPVKLGKAPQQAPASGAAQSAP